MNLASALPTLEQRSNFKRLYADIFWWGILGGSTISFINIFATRAGATSFHLGLMTAGPAVINLAFSLPAGRWLESRDNLRMAYLTSIINRLGYLFFIFLPLISLSNQSLSIYILIGLTLLMAIPGVILVIAFNAMFADIVPPEFRAEIVGKRNALVALSLTTTSLISGQILDKVAFPHNYEIVFAMGLAGGLLSCYYIGRLHLQKIDQKPQRVGQPILDFARPGTIRGHLATRFSAGARFLTRSEGKSLFRPDLLRGPYGKFMLACFVFYACQYLPIPLFPTFFVNELQLTDSTISLGTSFFHATMLLTSVLLRPASKKLGYHRLLVVNAAGYAIYPLLNGITDQVWVFLLASLLGGATWGLLSGALLNRLMERVPGDDRPAHMALHNLALHLGVLLGSFMGPVFSDWIGIRPALLSSAGLRILSAILLIFWG